MNNVGDVHVIIQARMDSTRLPRKIIMPFAGGRTFLEWIVERARTSRIADKVIVATTTKAADDAIEALCIRHKYDYSRGSEEDVLGRYAAAAQKFGSRIIVRITSDNPLTDIAEMDRMLEILNSEKLDYVTNHLAGLPVGSGAEVFTFAALERVAEGAKDSYEREHVTPYFYRHPELFKQRHVAPREIYPFALKARLTLDTIEDLEFFRSLAAHMGLSDPAKQPTTGEILSFLEKHQEIVAINKDVVQKTSHKA